MLRPLFTVAAALLALSAGGCWDESDTLDTFPCGLQGGRCLTGIEVCIVGDGECAACVPLEVPCAADDGCGCLDEVDFSTGDYPCADAPMCMPSGDGLAISCAADGWGCG